MRYFDVLLRSAVWLCAILFGIVNGAHAFNNTCAANFREVARLRRSPDYKNNPQLLIWMYEEAGLVRASARLRKKVEEAMQRPATDELKVKADTGNLVNTLDFGQGIKGIWKPKTSGTIRQVTVYRFDQFLGARMVPVSAETEYLGKKVVVQLYVPGTDGEKMAHNPHHLSLFDYLLNSRDRHQDNHLSFHGRTIAIDDENAFSLKSTGLPVPDFPDILLDALKENDPATASNIIAPALINREVVEKLRTATNAQWREVLKELTQEEFDAFLIRKGNAVTAINIAERKLGQTIFPAGSYSPLARNPWARHIERFHEARRPESNLPQALKDRLRLVLDIIERETEFKEPLTPSQRQRVEDALIELDAHR